MPDSLTDKQFCRTYWSRRPDLIREVPRSILFSDLFESVVAGHRVRSALDLGGFPGHYCVFLEKYFGVQTTPLDFVIEDHVIAAFREVNGLDPDSITVAEEDPLSWRPANKYDLVFSLGLIEHFADTRKMIELHASSLNEGGVLLIGLPNFRGINGAFQRAFDPDNYSKHNIACMDPDLLASLCREQGLRDVRCWYHMKFGVWLEDPEGKSAAARLSVAVIRFLGKVLFRLIPVTGRLGFPYIFLTARRDSGKSGETPGEV
jgi:SAM-dependent methyltransferase